MIDPSVILVVDDDSSIRNAIRRLLLSQNLPVQLFASAEQFLSQVHRGVRGCLILDLGLPGMSGLQLQEQLVAGEWHLPIIVITARDDEAVRDDVLRMGAIACLKKPFDQTQLLAGVHTAMAQI